MRARAAASVILPETEIKTQLDNVEIRLGNVETRLGNVETRLDKVEIRLADIEKSLAVLKAMFFYLYGPVTLGLLVRIAFFQ